MSKTTKKQQDQVKYNLEDGEKQLNILGNNYPVKDLTYKYEKQILNLIDDDLIEKFDQEVKEGGNVLKFLKNGHTLLKELILSKLPLIVSIIAKSYDVNVDPEELEDKMTLGQMIEVVIVQYQRNLNSSKVVKDFFTMMINQALMYLLNDTEK